MEEPNKHTDFLLCSNCFKDEGLKIQSYTMGIESSLLCKSCNTTDGKKLTSDILLELAHVFFVRGTSNTTSYGGAPVVQFNEYQKTSIDVSGVLKEDTELISQSIKVGFFYYGPRLWMIGEIEPLKKLQDSNTRSEIIQRILLEYPSKILSEDDIFFKLRKNPARPHLDSEYDSPPEIGKGRLDSVQVPILYGSQDIQVCIHECRVTVEDELYLATLQSKHKLKLLDLTQRVIETGVTEFESLDLSIAMLFNARDHSYEISRDIAVAIKNEGYDGLVYPSYFASVRRTTHNSSKFPAYAEHKGSDIIPNIALFGKPVKEDKIFVKCINRLLLNTVDYDISFGPASY